MMMLRQRRVHAARLGEQLLQTPFWKPSHTRSLCSRPKTGIVMMNLGGPSTQEEVEPFLSRLFSDPEIVQLPLPPFLQKNYVGPFIAKRRSPRIRSQYAAIGGGSPIRMWTEKQGAMMTQLLDTISPTTAPHKAYIAFRYAKPLTEEALLQMAVDGVERAVAFTQYPQWSCTTTGSSLNELWRELSRLGLEKRFSWSVIDRWGTHPYFIEAVTKNIQDALHTLHTKYGATDPVILFSAHSLPHKVINKGDTYPQEVGATVEAVMERLGKAHKYLLCYQSQVGPAAWLGPQTIETVAKLRRGGHIHIALVPIAFTSDHIETLYELDIEVQHKAKQHGIDGIVRASSLNDDPLMATALAEIVNQHLAMARMTPCGPQYSLRCPGCNLQQCRNIVNPVSPYRQPPLLPQ